MSYNSIARALSHIQHIFITGGGKNRNPLPRLPAPRNAGFTERVPRCLALLASVALSGVPSRALSRTLRLLSALCLSALSRHCLTLSTLLRITLARITLSLRAALTILRMQRLQTRR